MGETVANVRAEWSGGDLVFKDNSANTVMTLQTGRPNEYDEYCVAGFIESAEVTGNLAYIPIAHSGQVVNLQIVPHAAVASAAVNFTALVSSTSAITHSALTLASGATAGTVSSVAPTAENSVDEDEAVLVQSGGGGTATFNATVVLTVRRT